jgi:hypothetical protein
MSVKLTGALMPEIHFDTTVAKFAESIVRKELLNDRDFNTLPTGVQDKAVAEGAMQLIAQAEKNLKMKIDPAAPVANVFYDYLNGVVLSWKESFGNAFTLVWAVALFIFLRGIGVVLVFLSTLLAGLFYGLLISTGAVAVIAEQTVKERIVLM